METFVVERSIWIDAPPEKVWRAVTEVEQLNQWYATCCEWEIPALTVGTQVKFYNTPDEPLFATIEVVDPPREFTVHWQPDATYPAMSLITSFLLTEENGGIRVTIRESGYEALSAAEREAWMKQAGEGYAGSVENLKALLEGQPLPYK